MPTRPRSRAIDPLYRAYEACDIERSVVRAHPAVRARSCAVSTVRDGVVVTAEVTSPDTDPSVVEQAIRLALVIDHGLHLHSLELNAPRLTVVA